MNQFERVVLLPSGGIEYSPIAYIRPITIEYQLISEDPFFSMSIFERIISLIKRYSNIQNPENFYTADIYYLWALIEGKERFKIAHKCTKCDELNELTVALKDLDIKFLDRYSSIVELPIKLETENAQIYYRRRKACDNLEFGIKELNLREDSDYNSLNLIYYFLPQITSINVGGQEISQNQYFEFFKFCSTKSLKKIFLATNVSDFGIENDILYKCKKCEFENRASILHNAVMSAYHGLETSQEDFKDSWKLIFQLSKSKLLSASEIKELTFDQLEILQDTIRTMKFVPGTFM